MAASALRTCLLAVLLSLGLGVPLQAWAQDAGSSGDAGVSSAPDASAGEGGADRDNPEGDDNVGRVAVNCRSTSDCNPRFSCVQGKCHYTGVRDAERVGCLVGPEAAVVLTGLGLVALWRRRS